MAEIARRLPPAAVDQASLAQKRAAAGLIAFVATLAVLAFVVETLSQVGVPQSILIWLVAGFALAVPVCAAAFAPTVSRAEFAVACRRVAVAGNAAAGAAALFGSVFAVGLGAASFRGETEMPAVALGLCGGLILSGVIVAPYMRRSAAASPGDFLAARFGGSLLPALCGLVVTATLFPMLVAELSLAGMVGSWTLGIGRTASTVVMAILMLIPALIGGMRGATLAGVLQFVLLLAAMSLASIWVSWIATGYAVPLAGFVSAAGKLEGLAPASAVTAWRDVGLGLCVALGIAGLPTLLQRSATTGSAQSARSSLAWTLLFVALFSIASVAMAAVARWTIEDISNQSGSASALVESQPWTTEWSAREGTPVKLCGLPVPSADDAALPCADLLKPGDLAVDPDIALLAAPDIAGAPPLFAMLVASGCLAASIGGGSLLLLGIGRALAHDLLGRLIMRRAPTSRRLLVERLALIVALGLALHVVANPPAGYFQLALTSLSLSASGLFPAMLAAVWWRRANQAGAFAGMLVGFAVAAYLAAGALYDPAIFAWLEPAGLVDVAKELGSERGALAAVPAGLIILIVVSLVTRAPGAAQRDVADALLSPRDLAPANGE